MNTNRSNHARQALTAAMQKKHFQGARDGMASRRASRPPLSSHMQTLGPVLCFGKLSPKHNLLKRMAFLT